MFGKVLTVDGRILVISDRTPCLEPVLFPEKEVGVLSDTYAVVDLFLLRAAEFISINPIMLG